MRIEKKDNNVIIKEDIITIKDAEEIINYLKSLQNYKEITLVTYSHSLPSNVISALLKLKDNGTKVKIITKDKTLNELLTDLGLAKVFEIHSM